MARFHLTQGHLSALLTLSAEHFLLLDKVKLTISFPQHSRRLDNKHFDIYLCDWINKFFSWSTNNDRMDVKCLSDIFESSPTKIAFENV